jgi:hypothetical protein
MRKKMWVILLLAVFGGLLIVDCVCAAKRDQGYLIITDNFCIMVKSPAKQLSRDIGLDPIDIILKDKTTKITIRGSYLAIEVPVAKLEETIKKYRLQKLTIIE